MTVDLSDKGLREKPPVVGVRFMFDVWSRPTSHPAEAWWNYQIRKLKEAPPKRG